MTNKNEDMPGCYNLAVVSLEAFSNETFLKTRFVVLAVFVEKQTEICYGKF